MKALTQVVLRLRANAFDMNHGLVLLPTSFPYIPQATESSKRSKYAKRDGSRDQDYSKLVRTGNNEENARYRSLYQGIQLKYMICCCRVQIPREETMFLKARRLILER